MVVSKTIPECGHTTHLPCHVEPNHKECTKPCEQILPCGHQCQLPCREDCTCIVEVSVKLQCEHEVQVACKISENPRLIPCPEKCKRLLPCGHYCGLKCGDTCRTKCYFKVKKEWPCGHMLRRPSYQTATPEEHLCDHKCTRELECRHACTKQCGELCDQKCRVIVSKQYTHVVTR